MTSAGPIWPHRRVELPSSPSGRSVRRPDADYDFPSSNIQMFPVVSVADEVEIASLDVIGRRSPRCRPKAGIMEMKHRARRADRMPGDGINPLDPRAERAIAEREVIKQGAVVRPVRMTAMIGHDRNPRLRRDRGSLKRRCGIDLADIRGVRRVKRNPSAIGREASPVQVPLRM
jgi:hypothetical protein